MSALRFFITCGGAEALAIKGCLTSDELATWCGTTRTDMAKTLNILRHHELVILEEHGFRLGTLGPATADAVISSAEAEILPQARRATTIPASDCTQHAELEETPAQKPPDNRAHLAHFGDTIAAAIGRELARLGASHFHSAHTVAQIGGGQGDLLAAILAAYPHLQGILVGWPGADPRAQDYLTTQGLQHRVKLTPGHLPTQVPAADRILVARLLRHLPDHQCLRLLAAVCATLFTTSDGDSQLWYIDGPLPAPQRPSADLGEAGTRAWDIILTGIERSTEDLRALMEKAGLHVQEERSLSHDQYLVIAIPASRHSSA
ncbi:methyltransferase [Nonomuraea sp. NPDC049784]|uniref:methyltransferase n=1 Tax=Nonomuraea sp. NPDC049784 TaxID=3154361 RepID=UPI0033FD5FEA